MQKLNPLRISFGISILFHAALLGAYGIYEFNVSKPALQQEDNLVTLNLVAALDEPAVQTPIVKAVAPIQPLPPEKPIEKIIPVEIVKPIMLPQPQRVVSIPQSNEVSVIAKPDSQTDFHGDASSSKPGQDATTLQAKPNVEAKPNYLKNPEPVYPESARRRRQEGLVLLAVTVTTQGRVSHIEVNKSSGFFLLDDAALQAVRDWEFEPARIGSVALESQIGVPVRFELTPQ
jgi:protein TonB